MDETPELIAAFHLMWDHFPGPCSLIHKSKRVVAVNQASKDMGRNVGMRCIETGAPENHKGCLAAQALTERRAQRIQVDAHGTLRVVFWLPVDGYDDYYTHFSIRVDSKE